MPRTAPRCTNATNDGKTRYIVDDGEVFTDFYQPTPFYTVPKSGVIWTVTYIGG
jgi:hypothetical protein